jgi:hypothetical protein
MPFVTGWSLMSFAASRHFCPKVATPQTEMPADVFQFSGSNGSR